MKMRQEDLVEVGQADARPHQLPLRALAAVEEQPLTPAADEEGGRCAPGGGRAAGGTEKDKVQIHTRLIVASRRLACRSRYGRTSFCPGVMTAPDRWFACSMRHTPSRTSPP